MPKKRSSSAAKIPALETCLPSPPNQRRRKNGSSLSLSQKSSQKKPSLKRSRRRKNHLSSLSQKSSQQKPLSSKKSNSSIKKQKRIPFNSLTKQHDFGAFQENMFLVRQSETRSKVRQFIFGLIEVEEKGDNDDDDDDDDDDDNKNNNNNNNNKKNNVKLKILKLSAAARVHLLDKYKMNQWYRVNGGKVNVYQGIKCIDITSVTNFTLLKNLRPPNIELLLNNRNVVNNFDKLRFASDQVIPQYYFTAHVMEMIPRKKFVEIWCKDANSNKILIRDYHSSETEIKLGTQLLASGLSKVPYFNKVYLACFGCIFYFKNKKCDDWITFNKDLSTLNLDEEMHTAKELTMQEIINAKENGGLGLDAFYKIYNVEIKKVSKIFKLTDKDDNILTKVVFDNTMVLESNTGKERLLRDSDKIEYFINVKVVDPETLLSQYMSGFDECGTALFNNIPADILFHSYSSKDIDEVTREWHKKKFTLSLQFSYRKKAYWWNIAKFYAYKEEESNNDDEQYNNDEQYNDDHEEETNNDDKEGKNEGVEIESGNENESENEGVEIANDNEQESDSDNESKNKSKNDADVESDSDDAKKFCFFFFFFLYNFYTYLHKITFITILIIP